MVVSALGVETNRVLARCQILVALPKAVFVSFGDYRVDSDWHVAHDRGTRAGKAAYGYEGLVNQGAIMGLVDL